MNTRSATLTTAALCAATLCTGASPLQAQDDRDTTTPTAAVWYTGRTTAQLASLVQAGWRFVDLEVESATNGRFTVSAVRNSGAYAKSWWYYYNVSPSYLSGRLSANNGRLIDLEVYELNGQTRMTAIMIRNAGADAKAWWWQYGATSSQVNSLVQSRNARLVNLERYTINGNTRFASVMISNTGNDAKAWGYYYNASLSTITNYLSQNNMRVYSIEPSSSGRWDAIMVRSPGQAWWHYYGVTSSQATALLQQNEARLIDVERRGSRFDIVMLDNANALERRARSILLNGTDGTTGVYLKQVNGPVLASINEHYVFEPASLLKTLYHVHAMRQVRLGNASLSELLPVPLGMNGSCPQGNGTIVNETLQTVLRRMMENSDNARTRAIAVRFGLGNINATADALGMTRTNVNHTIGCGGPTPNQLTLDDIGELHQDVANGYLGTQRDTFYDLMVNNLGFPTWGPRDLDDLIDQEAANLGLPTSLRDAFKSQLRMAYKPGGYTINGRHFHSEGGFVRVPFKNAQGAIAPQEFVFGAFNHQATNLTNSRNAMSDAALEVVWDRVRAGLRSWDNYVSGSILSFGSGCASSAGFLRHDAVGTPDIGRAVSYRLQNAAPGSTALLGLGYSRNWWGRTRLPFFFPGTRCGLYIGLVDSIPSTVGRTGSTTVRLSYPNDTSLVGFELLSQFLVFDNAANGFGLASSNALQTTLGGYR
jgi:hypothetical protein